jgi:hypothetical protein
MTSGKFKLYGALSGVAVLGTVLAMSVGAAFAGPAGASVTRHHATTSQRAAMSQHAESVAAPATGDCPSGDFCAYSSTNYQGNYEDFHGNDDQWNSGIINQDESIINNSYEWVRLYYGPDYGDPHTCIVAEGGDEGSSVTNFPDLLSPFKFYFNSNESGSTKYVWRDVHGSTMDYTICTGPMTAE